MDLHFLKPTENSNFFGQPNIRLTIILRTWIGHSNKKITEHTKLGSAFNSSFSSWKQELALAIASSSLPGWWSSVSNKP